MKVFCPRKGPSGLCFFLAVIAGLVMALTAGPGVWRDAGAQTEGRVPGEALGKTSDSDMWRAVRRGEGGLIVLPDVRPEQVLTAPFDDCVKADNCTEAAVGFSMPIHAIFPPIREPQGKGTSSEALGLLAVVFGGGLIAGLLFLLRLGRSGGGATADEG